MRKMRRFISAALAGLILLTSIPQLAAKVSAQVITTDDTYATVIGDFENANGFGNDWDPANSNCMMKTYQLGIYEITLNFTKAGNYQYKIAMNGTTDECYGSASGNIALNVTQPEKIIFRMDYSKKAVYDSINNPDVFPTATLCGTLAQTGGSDWKTDDSNFDLDYTGGGNYSKTFNLKAGTYQYKIAFNHALDSKSNDENQSFTLKSDAAVTFFAQRCEYDGNYYCNSFDSVNWPEMAKHPSLAGTFRKTGAWDASAKGYEFCEFGGPNGYIYSTFLPAGTYQYKVCNNYSWDDGGIVPDKDITVPTGGKYVVFLCCEYPSNQTGIVGKIGQVNDSINDPEIIADCLRITNTKLSSPKINIDGSVTFSYNNPYANDVYLEGDLTNWAANKKQMTKDSSGNWSVSVRPGDAAADYEYMFVVDGKEITDPLNKSTRNGHSLLSYPNYTGCSVKLYGNFPDEETFQYAGNGKYNLTIKNLPAGTYNYCALVANGDYGDLYGQNGEKNGNQILLENPVTQDVSFVYDDSTHIITNSVKAPTLCSAETGSVQMTDSQNGYYYADVTLNKGTYTDFTIESAGMQIPVSYFTVNSDNTKVKLSYDPASQYTTTDLNPKDINAKEIYYDSQDIQYKSPYGSVSQGTPVNFNLKCAKDDLTAANLVVQNQADGSTQNVAMSKNGAFDGTHDKWSCSFTPSDKGQYSYFFTFTNGSQVKAYTDDNFDSGSGMVTDTNGIYCKYSLDVSVKGFTTPDWLKNAIIYQIFPDRFFNGDTSNDHAKTYARGTGLWTFHNDWYSLPDNGDWEKRFDLFGGDLKGIQDRLDYIKALGTTVIYLNPICDANSNHRYDTADYEKVDPFLGNLDDFASLIKEANKRGIHIILDGVYNHVSDDSKYFDKYDKYEKAGQPLGAYQYWKSVYDMMNAKGMAQSDAEAAVQAAYKAKGITDFHYKDWFNVYNRKESTGYYAYDYYSNDIRNDNMAKIKMLNGSEDNITSWKDDIISGDSSQTAFWLNQGISGYRLDTGNMISEQTWRTFRSYVKSKSDNNAIIGEIQEDASKYLLGDEYDSVMNYQYRNSLLDFLTGNQSSSFVSKEFEKIREEYPKEAFAALMNLVDSHDTERVLTTLNGDSSENVSSKAKSLMKLVPLMQMTYPGAPAIYYGDEMGMVGGGDPDDRRTMQWGKGSQDLVEWYALLGNIRNTYSVLRTGDINMVDTSNNDDVLSYVRSNSTDKALVVINRGDAVNGLTLNVAGSIPDGTVLTDAATGSKTYTVSGGTVKIDAGSISGLVLVTNYKKVSINKDALKPAYDSSYIVSYNSQSPTGTNNPGNQSSSSNPANSSAPSNISNASGSNGGTTEDQISNPKTGTDNKPCYAFAAVMIAAAAAFVSSKKRRHEKTGSGK